MRTECIRDSFGFQAVKDRSVAAGFDGKAVSSDAGALLLAADRVIGLIERFAARFTDHRDARLVEREVKTLVGRRMVGTALGGALVGSGDRAAGRCGVRP